MTMLQKLSEMSIPATESQTGDGQVQVDGQTATPAVDPNATAEAPAQVGETASAAPLSFGKLEGDKIDPSHIDTLVQGLEYTFVVFPETNRTECAALLRQGEKVWVVATGFSSCVDKANFDAEKGQAYAKKMAEAQAREKLWELEGWRLWVSAATQGLAD